MPRNSDQKELNERALNLLKTLIEQYIKDGEPVGSRTLARALGLSLGAATIRNVMAELEERGLLVQPHTSAGRVPTDRGYRVYVDELLAAGTLPVPRRPLELTTMRREVDEAMRATSEQLSQVTNLLALVTAPPIETATIRRVEVLLLQPQVAMVVVVWGGGAVTRVTRLGTRQGRYATKSIAAPGLGIILVCAGAAGGNGRAGRARAPT